MTSKKFYEIFNTPYFTIEATMVNYAEGFPYYRINTSDSIICCLINTRDELLLAKQMRPNLGYETLEFPAGAVESNETPLMAARREVKEELGFNSELIYLGSFRLMMNRTINKEHLFIGLASNDNTSESEEGIDLVKIIRSDFANYVLKGKIEQLAALGIINLINIKFNLDFLNDKNIINRIWPEKLK
jgi:ADP-ribose pyrophosphatase YjhB (NUDIX family)